VLVTGGSGFLGSNLRDLVESGLGPSEEHVEDVESELKEKQDNESLMRYLRVKTRGFKFHFLSSKDCDLRSREKTEALFEALRPTYVVHLAARVGGLFANMQDKVGFYEDNS